MKKSYLFIIGLACALNAYTQITLTSATSTPAIGSTYTYVRAGTLSTSVIHSGANQTWDLSTVSGLSQYYIFSNVANSTDPITFSSANLVGNRVGFESYYSNTINTYSIIGKKETSVIREIYPDNIDVLKFPITYLDNFNGTFSGTKEFLNPGTTYNRSGTTTMIADGYGALILPYTTVNNVLKVTNTLSYTDSISGALYRTYVDTIITFYNSGTNNYIASVLIRYVDGNFSYKTAEYIVQSELVTGISNIINEKSNVVIFPNPTQDMLTIKSDEMLNKISILDVTGKLVKEIIPSFTLSSNIDVSDLNSGVYFVSYIGESGTGTQKVILE